MVFLLWHSAAGLYPYFKSHICYFSNSDGCFFLALLFEVVAISILLVFLFEKQACSNYLRFALWIFLLHIRLFQICVCYFLSKKNIRWIKSWSPYNSLFHFNCLHVPDHIFKKWGLSNTLNSQEHTNHFLSSFKLYFTPIPQHWMGN